MKRDVRCGKGRGSEKGSYEVGDESIFRRVSDALGLVR